MSNDNEEFGEVEWVESEEETKKSVLRELSAIPSDWSGHTRAAKVQKLVDVTQDQISRVREGNFDISKSERVAALALEGLVELADFYADAESTARHAKNFVEYTEADIASEYKNKASEKISEAALKRKTACSQEVKEAKKKMVDLEREHKKWRYIYETLKEAHIFFRNLGRA
jgi:hypothetical protein